MDAIHETKETIERIMVGLVKEIDTYTSPLPIKIDMHWINTMIKADGKYQLKRHTSLSRQAIIKYVIDYNRWKVKQTSKAWLHYLQ